MDSYRKFPINFYTWIVNSFPVLDLYFEPSIVYIHRQVRYLYQYFYTSYSSPLSNSLLQSFIVVLSLVVSFLLINTVYITITFSIYPFLKILLSRYTLQSIQHPLELFLSKPPYNPCLRSKITELLIYPTLLHLRCPYLKDSLPFPSHPHINPVLCPNSF